VRGESGGLVIFTDGLPEHEPIVEDGQVTLAVTLLRCVGSLSRGDLSTRRGHAGPAIPTPSAQCLGAHAFRLGIAPVAADNWAAVSNMAEIFFSPPVVAPLAAGQPVAAPFLTLAPDWLAMSSVQVSEDNASVIARFWNPTAAGVRATLGFGQPVRAVARSDADGHPRAALALDPAGRECELEIGPAEIVTVLVTP
jgi:alpha-mannosidase